MTSPNTILIFNIYNKGKHTFKINVWILRYFFNLHKQMTRELCKSYLLKTHIQRVLPSHSQVWSNLSMPDAYPGWYIHTYVCTYTGKYKHIHKDQMWPRKFSTVSRSTFVLYFPFVRARVDSRIVAAICRGMPLGKSFQVCDITFSHMFIFPAAENSHFSAWEAKSVCGCGEFPPKHSRYFSFHSKPFDRV